MKLKKIWGPVRRWFIRHDCYHGLPFFTFMILYLIWFRIVEMIPRAWYVAIVMPLDRALPFCEGFVIFYISWFFYIAFGAFFLYFKDRERFDELQTLLMMGMMLFLVLSTFLPNRQPLRLLEMPRDNIFTRLIAFLWKTDTPTDVWPSIHVYNSAVIMIAFYRSRLPGLRRPAVRFGITFWTVGIILSTMLIKQHTIFDVISALALTILAYLIVCIYGKVYHCVRWDAMWKEFPYWDDGSPAETPPAKSDPRH